MAFPTPLALSDLRRELRAIHPYLGDASVVVAGPSPAGWIPLTSLTGDPGILRHQILRRTQSRAGSDEWFCRATPKAREVAVASALFQTLVWRAMGPAIALAVIASAYEPGAPGEFVEFGAGGSIRFGHRAVRLKQSTEASNFREDQPSRLGDEVLEAMRAGPWNSFVAPVATAMQSVVRLGPRQLPGNAASPIASMVRLLVARNYLDEKGGATIHAQITSALGLSSFGSWRAAAPAPAKVWFQRTTCCLWCRVSSGTCGDCSLRTPGELDEAAGSWWRQKVN